MLNINNLYRTKFSRLDQIVHSFNLTEKTIFIILSLALIWSSLSLLFRLNSYFLTEIPAHGGSLTEGLIGTPRFINPLLELSDADRDLTYLVYSGLLRPAPTGELIPDLAESYSISADGLTYTFKIRDNATFHDGTAVTADDIIFTIDMAMNASLRSPKRTSWIGVTTKKISDTEITFELSQPYAPFLENTTLGILPKHIWNNASPDEFPFSLYNTEPIGSGPYQVSKIKRNNSGIPISYELESFNHYTLNQPFITTLKLNFYSNEKDLISAYQTGQINSTSALSSQSLEQLKNDSNINAEEISLPRVFGVFFNQNQAPIFLNKEVRSALNITVDKDRIVSQVLSGYGDKIDGPLPNGVTPEIAALNSKYDKDASFAEASAILTKAGWKLNETDHIWEKKASKKETQRLVFSIATANTPDLKNTAEILKADWTEFGVKVEVQTFEPSDLNQSIISQRKYDALLFGEVVGRSLDLFAFWHSSQRNTGYNVALYTNSKADKLLEEARQISDKDARLKKYIAFETEIRNDVPAIFIYSPKFIYLLPNKIKGFQAGLINNRSERFENINNWYIETDKVWSFLTK